MKYKSLNEIESMRSMARGNIAMSNREIEEIPNRVKELKGVIARAEKCLIEMDEAEAILMNSKRNVIVYLTEEVDTHVNDYKPGDWRAQWFVVMAIIVPEGAEAGCGRYVSFEGKDYHKSDFDNIYYESFYHYVEPTSEGKWRYTNTTRKEALEAALAVVTKIQAEYPEATVFDSIPEYIYENEKIPEPTDTNKWIRCI